MPKSFSRIATLLPYCSAFLRTSLGKVSSVAGSVGAMVATGSSTVERVLTSVPFSLWGAGLDQFRSEASAEPTARSSPLDQLWPKAQVPMTEARPFHWSGSPSHPELTAHAGGHHRCRGTKCAESNEAIPYCQEVVSPRQGFTRPSTHHAGRDSIQRLVNQASPWRRPAWRSSTSAGLSSASKTRSSS